MSHRLRMLAAATYIAAAAPARAAVGVAPDVAGRCPDGQAAQNGCCRIEAGAPAPAADGSRRTCSLEEAPVAVEGLRLTAASLEEMGESDQAGAWRLLTRAFDASVVGENAGDDVLVGDEGAGRVILTGAGSDVMPRRFGAPPAPQGGAAARERRWVIPEVSASVGAMGSDSYRRGMTAELRGALAAPLPWKLGDLAAGASVAAGGFAGFETSGEVSVPSPSRFIAGPVSLAMSGQAEAIRLLGSVDARYRTPELFGTRARAYFGERVNAFRAPGAITGVVTAADASGRLLGRTDVSQTLSDDTVYAFETFGGVDLPVGPRRNDGRGSRLFIEAGTMELPAARFNAAGVDLDGRERATTLRLGFARSF